MRFLTVLLALILPLLPLSLHALGLAISHSAEATLIDKVNNQAIVAGSGLYLNYRESIGDGVKGTIPGISLQIIRSFNNSLYTEVAAEFEKGNLQYNGFFFDLYHIAHPLNAGTLNSILNLNADIGAIFPLKQSWPDLRLIYYLELGYRQWERTVPPPFYVAGVGVNSFTEEYNNFDYMAGIKLEWKFAENAVLVPNAGAGLTLNPTIKANVPDAGIFIAYNANLGQSYYYQLGAALYWFITPNTNLNLSAKYETFAFGTASKNVDGIYEPSSTTNQLRFKAGVGFAFS